MLPAEPEQPTPGYRKPDVGHAMTAPMDDTLTAFARQLSAAHLSAVWQPLPRALADLVVRLVTIWRRLRQGIFDSYRPELHYMRGPGPKWREKHARVTSVVPVSRHP
jgi:hypothetical protein